LAEPGTTYVSEDTFKLTEGFFRFEGLGEKQIKGKAEPVGVYRVIGPSTLRTRFDVNAERGLTPFVGRERELELLLDGFERAKSGRGQAFSIMGEAGVGKSRLLYEFRKAVSNEDVTLLEGKCLSFGRGVAYHPIIDILKGNFDIREGDSDFDTRNKVKRGLKAVGVDEDSTLPYLLDLLSVKDSGFDKINMSPEGKRHQGIEALKRIALKGSELRPLVLAIEDLHWADESSEDTLKYLLGAIAGSRIFLVLTYRPEFVPTWAARTYHNQVTLNRLSNRESLAMVSHLFGTQEIDSTLQEVILEKTEGIPFYIEELIKSLKDLRIVEKRDNRYGLSRPYQEIAVPSTIQDVIMARVDALPEDAKEVLQSGSVIEREFGHDLIERVTGLPEQQLLSQLSVLKDAEFLYERGIYPQTTYIFRHALTREVVYESMLTIRREELHQQTARAIEELNKDNIAENFGVLAQHYISGRNYDKGAEYSKLAARKARKTDLLNDAISYGEKRVACLERLEATDAVFQRIIDARTTLGLYYLQGGPNWGKARNAVESVTESIFERDDKRRIAQIYLILGCHSIYGEDDPTDGLKQLREASRVADQINDIASLSLVNYWMGLGLSEQCEFEEAMVCLERVLNIHMAVKNLSGISVIKANIGFWVHNRKGRIREGYKETLDALSMAESSGDAFSMGLAYGCHGYSCYCKGFFEQATESCGKAVEICERTNHLGPKFWSLLYLYETYFDLGEYQKSRCYDKKLRLVCNQIGFKPAYYHQRIGGSKAMVMNNEKDIDLKALYDDVAKNKLRSYDGAMKRDIGEVLLNIDDGHLSEAEDWIKKAIDADTSNGLGWQLGRDYALYSELLKRKGDGTRARENLTKAIDILRQCGADGWVTRYEEELARL
ncbi:AAA family ATPase, partial [Thermodesulfobacteriota bacterium]